jgi:hypothetical protein
MPRRTRRTRSSQDNVRMLAALRAMLDSQEEERSGGGQGFDTRLYQASLQIRGSHLGSCHESAVERATCTRVA